MALISIIKFEEEYLKVFPHALRRTLDQLLGLGMCFLGFSPLRLELRLALFIGRALDG